MKLPRTFSTGDPSYFVVASTSGSVSPTVLTVSNVSAGICFVGLRFIEAQYSPSRDAIQANLEDVRERSGCSQMPCSRSCGAQPELV